jgi:hypothetical protein
MAATGYGSPQGRVYGEKGDKYWDTFGKSEWVYEDEEPGYLGWYQQFDRDDET